MLFQFAGVALIFLVGFLHRGHWKDDLETAALYAEFIIAGSWTTLVLIHLTPQTCDAQLWRLTAAWDLTRSPMHGLSRRTHRCARSCATFMILCRS